MTVASRDITRTLSRYLASHPDEHEPLARCWHAWPKAPRSLPDRHYPGT